MANREITDKKQENRYNYSIKKLASDLLIVVMVGVFVGYLAPFGMDDVPFYLSIAFWCVTCIVGYFIYAPTIFVVDSVLREKILTHWQRVAIATLFASVIMAFTIPIITWLFFSMPIAFVERFINMFPKALVIGGVITFVSYVRDKIEHQRQQLIHSEQEIAAHQQVLNKNERDCAQSLIQQLPLEKRGELLCLEMSDHYLKVYTDKGHHLVLMRFKDALSQLADYPGLQTHRSWWVAHSAVTSVKKDNRKITLVLKSALEVPVSRTYSEAVKSAGFL